MSTIWTNSMNVRAILSYRVATRPPPPDIDIQLCYMPYPWPVAIRTSIACNSPPTNSNGRPMHSSAQETCRLVDNLQSVTRGFSETGTIIRRFFGRRPSAWVSGARVRLSTKAYRWWAIVIPWAFFERDYRRRNIYQDSMNSSTLLNVFYNLFNVRFEPLDVVAKLCRRAVNGNVFAGSHHDPIV